MPERKVRVSKKNGKADSIVTTDLRIEKKYINQAAFLEGIREMGTVRNGMKKAGIQKTTYYEWMSNDPLFPDRLLDAKQDFAEALEEVIVGLVMDPEVVKKVPILAITLLNANLPNKYRPQSIVQDETARDLLREWRKAARENPKTVGSVEKELDVPVEQQIDEILKRKQGSE